MSLPKLTPTDLDTLVFKRFRAVFNLSGAWALKDDPSTFAQEWMRVLKWSHPEEVSRGVDRWLAGGKDKWPTPGQLFHCILETQPQRRQEMMAEEESDWYAFPVTAKDVQGPRYRLMPFSQARANGMNLVSQATCPDQECRCWAQEVMLRPQDSGVRFKPAVALAVANPRGWVWAHYATEQKMTPAR